MKYIRKKYS